MLVSIHPEFGSDYLLNIPMEYEDDGTYSAASYIEDYICDNLFGVESYDIITDDDEITFSSSYRG